VTLQARRNGTYTLWSAPFESTAIAGNYFVVSMWFCVYRLTVLLRLLDLAAQQQMTHLVHIEDFFKRSKGYAVLRQMYPEGRYGYINMQRGGIEMHRNKRWRSIMQDANAPIL
jgi:hypothetical protein